MYGYYQRDNACFFSGWWLVVNKWLRVVSSWLVKSGLTTSVISGATCRCWNGKQPDAYIRDRWCGTFACFGPALSALLKIGDVAKPRATVPAIPFASAPQSPPIIPAPTTILQKENRSSCCSQLVVVTRMMPSVGRPQVQEKQLPNYSIVANIAVETVAG